MGTTDDSRDVSRRSVLKASGGAFGLLGIGSTRASDGERLSPARQCPDATIQPGLVHYKTSGVENCADDHPATRELKRSVKDSLETHYPTVGALIDRGYIPYFDFLTSEDGDGWSHWLNPEFLSDDTIVNPDRPESILVDHKWWRPIGVMFIATREGERVDSPPPVYSDGGGECLPWHSHVGLPGRYAWWKYRLLYEDGFEGDTGRLPCRTPWMMHVWAYPHPESVYAHGAPPRGNRGGPPAERAGFATDAVPGEDELDWDVFPDMLLDKVAHR